MKPEEIVAEAIALRKCLRSTYNGDLVRLAPHVLYTHHDEFFTDAITVERNGAAPKKIKMGVFKLTGLKKLALDDQPFVALRKFQPHGADFKGTVIATV